MGIVMDTGHIMIVQSILDQCKHTILDDTNVMIPDRFNRIAGSGSQVIGSETNKIYPFSWTEHSSDGLRNETNGFSWSETLSEERSNRQCYSSTGQSYKNFGWYQQYIIMYHIIGCNIVPIFQSN